MSKVAVVIPARLASTRLPRKVLRDILGKPLIQWVYEGCAEFTKDVWVVTPDNEIIEVVNDFGGVCLKTPPAINVLDRCSWAAGVLNDRGYDSIIVVQGDEPMVVGGMLEHAMLYPHESIVQLIKLLADDEDPWNPNIPKVVIGLNDYIVYASRCPIPGTTPEKDHSPGTIYYKQVCVMRFEINTLMRYQHMKRGPVEASEGIDILRYIEHGDTYIKVVVSPFDTKAVDTMEDLEEVRRMLA